ncbi:MAG: hypothetical protein C5B52_15945 [Bacteroidetes bacterium]|nr:MAG: hypothetical protein C5B52_15945 [Bacteroidota bacterium]
MLPFFNKRQKTVFYHLRSTIDELAYPRTQSSFHSVLQVYMLKTYASNTLPEIDERVQKMNQAILDNQQAIKATEKDIDMVQEIFCNLRRISPC